MFESILVWTNVNPVWTHLIVSIGLFAFVIWWESHYSDSYITPLALLVNLISWVGMLLFYGSPLNGNPKPTPMPDLSHWWPTTISAACFIIPLLVAYRDDLKYELKTYLLKFELMRWLSS